MKKTSSINNDNSDLSSISYKNYQKMDMNQLGSGPKLNISQTKLKHIVTE